MTFSVKDWRNDPDHTTPISAAALEDLESRLSTYTDTHNTLSVATSLPGSPVDGQVVALKANAAAGVVWMLRYNSGSASTYKWEFIGGAPLIARAAGSTTIVSGTYAVAPDGNGPTLSLPAGVGGDFNVSFGANFDIVTNNGGCDGWMSVTPSAADGDSIDMYAEGTGGNDAQLQIPNAGSVTKLSVASAAAFTAQYKVTAGFGSTSFAVYRRWIQVTPVRVG